MVYVIATDEYMGMEPDMHEFTGTYRELLNHLLGVDEIDEDDDYSERSDEELVNIFNEGNGDGQPFVMVWSVSEKRKVL